MPTHAACYYLLGLIIALLQSLPPASVPEEPSRVIYIIAEDDSTPDGILLALIKEGLRRRLFLANRPLVGIRPVGANILAPLYDLTEDDFVGD